YDYYMVLNPGYHIKNKLFDSVAKLLLVKGMTMEIYEKLKEYVTIFPREGQFTVNFDTASEIVLKALSYSVLDTVVAEKADADSMVMKLIEYRRGEDGVEFTKDDRVIELSDIGINAKERVISLAINPYRVKKSNFIRIQVNAVQEARNVEANIESIVKRDDLSVVYWKRQ
ncbi:MAG: general secretion pathway protein GspK, partial [Candidatus Omnitrophica bacterium]|nr:general secretion pathway protein GspK [Candidatus Omnitrophota bacterium]